MHWMCAPLELQCPQLLRTLSKSVLLQAAHEGPILGVSCSADGRRIGSVTSTGCVGALDLDAAAYTTLLRSHTKVHRTCPQHMTSHIPPSIGQPVLRIALSNNGERFATVSADSSVRIWDKVG